ncbi:MAG: acylneuraminate cytidylyltransferase family protein [Candidatus Omnitrophica bacterium]|nr:acylneuraminate cytidylyltransferase family protein [Candidatus Omnitrophota bacterium]
MDPFILGAVFARGGSKGIPRKNIKLLNGKPLIGYAVEAGLSVKLINELIVSTDDQETANVARQAGAKVPFIRPSELAQDNSTELDAWKHAIASYEEMKKREVDILVSIPATSPLREVKDIERCIQKILDTDADVVITITEADRNPYFNMVKMQDDDAQLLMSPGKVIAHRQDAPRVFDMTTVAYAARAFFIKQAENLFEGKVKAVVIPKERAFDIDTPLDFEIIELLMKKRNGSL